MPTSASRPRRCWRFSWPLTYAPGGLVTFFCVLYVLAEIYEKVATHFGRGLFGYHSATEEPAFRLTLTFFAAGILGVLRVVQRHPFFQEDYARWLALSPWRKGRPLPAGPVHLGFEDALLVLALTGLDARFGWGYAVKSPLCFLLPYGLVSMVALAFLLRPYFYLIAGGLSAFCFVSPTGWGWVGLALGLYAAVWIGNEWLLAHFPWTKPDGSVRALPKRFMTMRLQMQVEETPLVAAPAAGWPHTFLLDIPPGPRVGLCAGLALSFLAGWWLYALGHAMPRAFNHDTVGGMAFIVLMAALVRLIIYCKGTLPPISLFGRIFTGRWIQWQHDLVYLPSLASAGFAYGLYYSLEDIYGNAGWSWTTEMSVCACAWMLGVGLAILLLAPPTLRRWRLLGAIRTSGPSSLHQNPRMGLARI